MGFRELYEEVKNGDADVVSLLELVDCYYWGEGVERNLDEARRWYKEAVANGYTSELWTSEDDFE